MARKHKDKSSANARPAISKITPRRAPNTRGRHPASYPDLNLQQLAPLLGVSATHIGRILNGVCRPSMDLASKLAGLMNWSIDQVNGLYKQKQKTEQKAEPREKEREQRSVQNGKGRNGRNKRNNGNDNGN